MKKIALFAMSCVILAGCSGKPTVEDVTYKTNVNSYSVQVTAFDIYSSYPKDKLNGLANDQVSYIDQNKSSREEIVRSVVKDIKNGDKIAFRSYSSNTSQVGGIVELKNTMVTPYISSYEVFYIDNVRKEEKKFSEVVQGNMFKFQLKENNSTLNKSPYVFSYKIDSSLLEKIVKQEKIEMPYVSSKNSEQDIYIKDDKTVIVRYNKNIDDGKTESQYKNIETYFVISVKVD